MKYISKRQVLLLHEQLIDNFGGSCGLREESLLDSSLNAPLQTFDDKELYPSLTSKAARLAYGIISNHPFVDGNKRIGTHTMLLLLAINGIELSYSDNDLINVIMKVASGDLNHRDLEKWIEEHII
ncbi:type II toxin-antitoxin system death-on-curing family toxin [Ignavigranum ruoffiae]|uniref:type II toxin-antitoxin system death-on-curing family toxin n=1 Tax=Ignavigranum ruoffiae TaxID=89093 RepID=UPI0024AE266A|nr:type II toxin-antitoxin system death-on-curing family toxin [Ignavigranum ruoffiae]